MSGKHETQISVLANRFGLGRNKVQPAIQEAFAKGLVEFREIENDSRILVKSDYRVQAVEDALIRAFDVPLAIVVKTCATSSDLIHRDLGYAMARNFPPLVSNGSIIGLGSGRGPFYTTEGLLRRPKMSAQDVTLMSLTGAVFPRAHTEVLNRILDADYHVSHMGLCFKQPLVDQRNVSHPITQQKERKKYLARRARV